MEHPWKSTSTMAPSRCASRVQPGRYRHVSIGRLHGGELRGGRRTSAVRRSCEAAGARAQCGATANAEGRPRAAMMYKGSMHPRAVSLSTVYLCGTLCCLQVGLAAFKVTLLWPTRTPHAGRTSQSALSAARRCLHRLLRHESRFDESPLIHAIHLRGVDAADKVTP